MSAQAKVKTRCPVCKTDYQVPDSTVGHRARCPKCDSVFRVLVPNPPKSNDSTVRISGPAAQQTVEVKQPGLSHKRISRFPTEEDIMAWLAEGPEKDEIPREPRRPMISSPSPKPAVPAEAPAHVVKS